MADAYAAIKVYTNGDTTCHVFNSLANTNPSTGHTNQSRAREACEAMASNSKQTRVFLARIFEEFTVQVVSKVVK